MPQVLVVELLLLIVLVGSLFASAAYLTYNYRKNRLEALHKVQAGAMSFKRGISRLGSRLELDSATSFVFRATSFISRGSTFVSRAGSSGRESSRDKDPTAGRVHRAARYTETRFQSSRQFSDASRCTASDRAKSGLVAASSSGHFTAVVPVVAPPVDPSAQADEAPAHGVPSERSSRASARGESRSTRVRVGISGGSRSSSTLSIDGISCNIFSAATQADTKHVSRLSVPHSYRCPSLCMSWDLLLCLSTCASGECGADGRVG